MRVIVCGSRTLGDNPATVTRRLERIWEVLDDQRAGMGLETLIHGGAKGVDAAAARWALAHGVHGVRVDADWKNLGRKAGPIRNQAMLVHKPNLVIAFPGGAGTADMVRRALAAKVDVIEIAWPA